MSEKEKVWVVLDYDTIVAVYSNETSAKAHVMKEVEKNPKTDYNYDGYEVRD